MGFESPGLAETGLKDFKSAKKRFNDATTIYKDLGMEKSAEYVTCC